MYKKREKQNMARIQTLKRHAILTYFVLVYVLTWACWIPLVIAQDTTSVRFAFLFALGHSMPCMVGILLTAFFSGKSGLGAVFRRLGQVSNPLIWYVVVLLLLPVLWLVAVGVPTLLGLATIAFAFPVVSVFGSFVAGFNEELGWRGFALPRMQARQQALAASLLLGVLWSLWHLPLLVALGSVTLTSPGLVWFICFVLGTTAYSVLFAWVYNNTKGSLFLMVLFHAVGDIAPSTILYYPRTTWIVPLLYLILNWVVVTMVVRAGAARLSRKVVVAPAYDGERRYEDRWRCISRVEQWAEADLLGRLASTLRCLIHERGKDLGSGLILSVNGQ
jgi:membrane protease YdiL (CAAX protease family)